MNIDLTALITPVDPESIKTHYRNGLLAEGSDAEETINRALRAFNERMLTHALQSHCVFSEYASSVPLCLWFTFEEGLYGSNGDNLEAIFLDVLRDHGWKVEVIDRMQPSDKFIADDIAVLCLDLSPA